MKTDIYRLVTVKDGKTDTANIARVFSEIATGRLKLDLQLLNYYREVPVSYGATIVTVESDSVELTVHENQAVVMKQDKATLVKSRHFHDELGVHCYAAYVNVPKKTVVLHNFSYAQIRAERREAVRVNVQEKVAVGFSYGDVVLEGVMVDISGNGISLETGNDPEIAKDQPGQLNFTLAGSELSVPGTFVKSTANKTTGGTVSVFQMNPGRMSEIVIGQFIYQQQVEIIQELKDGLVLE